MEQLPELIVRGRYFTLFKNLDSSKREEIEQKITTLEKHSDISRHLNDTAKVFSRTIEGEYKDNLKAGRQEARIALWKALIVAYIDKKTFPTEIDEIRYCCGYMNNYVRQVLSENRRKRTHKSFKYHGFLKDIIPKSAMDIIGVDIDTIGTEHEQYSKLVTFIKEHFTRCNVTIEDGKIVIPSNYKINITINKKRWVVHQEINDNKWSQNSNTTTIDDDEFIDCVKSQVNENYNIILKAIIDGDILKGKRKLTAGVVSNYLKRHGIPCSKKQGDNIIVKFVKRLVTVGSEDERLLDYLVDNKIV